jgi:hypothetical protein
MLDTSLELAATGDAADDIEAMRCGGIGHEREAEQPDERRMLDEEATQIAHGAALLVELDEGGGHEGRTELRTGTRPGAIRGPFGEVRPVERSEQGPVLLGNGTRGDEGRFGEGGRRQGQRTWASGAWQEGSGPLDAANARVEPGRETEYHRTVSSTWWVRLW